MTASKAPQPIRIISHNIRYAADPPSQGERPWADRCPGLVAELIHCTRRTPEAFVCLQEVLHDQLRDILHGLHCDEENWTSVGVGRDDGRQAGEYAPIIYRSDVWHLDHVKTFWLSETPDCPSKGWDASSIRLVTLGVFSHKESGNKLVGMNTHLDDQGVVARREAAKLILKEADSWTGSQRWPNSLPLFVAGDMNSTEYEEAYLTFVSQESPLEDVLKACRPDTVYGFENTWTGFNGKGGSEDLKRIDFVFCGHRKGDWWKAEGHAVLGNLFDDNIYISDHRAVMADLMLLQGR